MMKYNASLTRADDSQNCYVYECIAGPGLPIVKVWVPRRMVKFNPPDYLDVKVLGITERKPMPEEQKNVK